MKYGPLLVAAALLFGPLPPAQAQLGRNAAVPEGQAGLDMARYPDLVRVPGSPVYYAPRLKSNYFFYDGLFWAYRSDKWYSSTWYNGPWQSVEPVDVPVALLRVPVRYYRQPPAYFRVWQVDAPPRWHQHWGDDWEKRRPEWKAAGPSAAEAPAPLPVYQRQYRGDAYPLSVEQQQAIRAEHYRYQPREPISRQQFEHRGSEPEQRPEPPRSQDGSVLKPRRSVDAEVAD